MQGKRRLTLFAAVLIVVFGYVTIATPLFAADKEKVLHNFNGNITDGRYPSAGLIFDASGNLYGTTINGGAYEEGTVFQLAPGANGTWMETVLYSFNKNHKDGRSPLAGLIFDAAGNLYGTTLSGGASGTGCTSGGCGTVFQLAPGANGTWTETVSYSFKNNHKDGRGPAAGLTLDAAGNLYGTTILGGAHNGGTVFQLAPSANGTWTETVLYSFCSARRCADGYFPAAGLIFDTAGNLYGTTEDGGRFGFTGCHHYNADGCGTVFELTPGANGEWTEKVLHSFSDNGKDGHSPFAGLTFDAAGNLYGTTYYGGVSGSGCGSYGCGTVFQLAPGANGTWTEKVLHRFKDNGKDGFGSDAGLILDAAGNLYGTTSSGGGIRRAGTVFEIMP